jgi:glycosyltransferase involved in cell wall biosynthesis
MKFTFWLSLFVIFYAYFGYALILMLIDAYQGRFVKTGKKRVDRLLPDHELPHVSFIIAAYNEQDRIAQKIENSLQQTYPPEKLEIIVASDCSSDRTDDIVRGYSDRGVKLLRAPERKGKEHAQLHAVKAAHGDILVFSDVATILKPDAIGLIVDNFQNPEIGCVSSEDRFIDRNGRVSGEGLYVKYEMFIRNLESRVNTLVGLSGSFFAARREVCQNWAPDLQSDFNTLLNTVKLGFKGISDPRSIGYYEDVADERKEFERKVRTVLRGITVLMRNRQMLNLIRHGMFSWQLLSHKLCRWLVPLFLIIALTTNFVLANTGTLYMLLFLSQILFYSTALIHAFQTEDYQKIQDFPDAYIETALKRKNAAAMRLKRSFGQTARIAYYFVSVNASIMMAWLKFIMGERATFWEPSKR